MAATGLLQEAPTVFEPHNNVMNAGVLFSLPALTQLEKNIPIKCFKTTFFEHFKLTIFSL
jgi:hypothetical protein